MRKKQQPTRKRRAIRWLAAFCLLVLVCTSTGMYGLMPESALRKQERYFFIDKTKLEFGLQDTYETDAGMGYVLASQNEDVLMLGLGRWTPWRGWQPGFAWPVERTGEAVEATYAYYSWDPDEGVYPYVVFGCVNDSKVYRLTLYLQEWQSSNDYAVDAELVVGSDGQRYFFENLLTEEVCTVRVVAWDHNGSVVQDLKVEDGMSLGHYDWDM